MLGHALIDADLSPWYSEFYGSSAPNWQVQADPTVVLQTRNSDPGFFCSDFDASGVELEGFIRVTTRADDDFIGFALGFQQGDTTNPDANYYLIDWKQVDQFWPPFGSTGRRGLAISEVIGIPSVAQFWGHLEPSTPGDPGVYELARGATLGSVGWQDDVEYPFRFVVTNTKIDTYINDQLEMSITGSFGDLLPGTSFCFYNFSQERVQYSGITKEELPTEQPSSPPSQSIAPSETPTLVPSSSPSCFPGKFTEACLPLVYLDDVFPSTGSDIGGYSVRVQGLNMEDGSIFCNFGPDYSVMGTYVSETEIKCVAPQFAISPSAVDGRQSVDLTVTIDGEDSFNSLPFEFFGLCPPTSCVNGFCSGGDCFCDPGFTGDACDQIIVAPVVESVSNQEAVAGELFEFTPSLSGGTLPVSWSISSTPFESGLSIDSTTGTIQLTGNVPKTLIVDISAENEGFVTTELFEINILPTYYIDGIRLSTTELFTGSTNPFIIIDGTCIERSSGNPLPFCDADIFVEKDGFRRILSSVGGPDGSFATTFVPFANEGGAYSVGGQVSGVRSDVVVASFSINGLAVSPESVRISGLTGDASSSTVTVSNVNPAVVLTGFTANLVSALPPEITDIDFVLDSSRLDDTSPSTTLNIIVSGVSSPVSAALEYEVTTSSSPAKVTGRFQVDIRAPAASLSVIPSSLQLRANRGQRSQKSIIVTNTGAAATGQLQVVLPADFLLLRVVSGRLVPSLSPGQSYAIVFESAPGLDEPFRVWNGNFQITSSGPENGLILNFRLEITSDTFGSIKVVVENEYTFYADDKPKLSGAQVSLRDLVTGATFENQSDDNGEAFFSQVPYGSYQLRASAEGHSEYLEVVTLESPQEELVYAFLALQLVSYSWSVTPKLIEEEYEVTIETTFTTYVPAPVIVIEPVQINLSVLRPGIDQINFKITNYGLVAVNNFAFDLPPANGLKFVPVFDGPIGDVPANTTIYYPVKVEAVVPSSRELSLYSEETAHRNLGAACTSGLAIYSVECRDTEWHFTKIGYIILQFECGSGDARIPVGDDGGRGRCCLHPTPSRGGTNQVACECQIAIFECIESFLKLPQLFKCLRQIQKCSDKLSDPNAEPSAQGYCTAKTIYTCAGIATPPPIKAIECALNLADECFDLIDNPLSRRQLNIELEDKIAAQNFMESSNAMETVLQTTYYPYGNYEDWNSLSESQLLALESRLDAAVADESLDQVIIADSELSMLVAAPLDGFSALISDFVRRWNRSMEYYSRGIYSLADVPPGEDNDMIDLEYLRQQHDLIDEANQQAQLRGYEDVSARWLADRDAVITASNRARDGICAKVRVQIKQQAILTREAFEAELQIENGGSDMTNIMIEIIIRNRETGAVSTELFVIDDPDLVGMTGVEGMGVLPASMSGTATWLFLALGEAAPTQPIEYDVSGIFSFVSDGNPTTINLQPDTILVSPDPQLELMYFHEYEIYGDDPFTLEVEPAVPYKLAVLIKNVGYGDALGFRVQSAQPVIIENDKGLLVDFEILSSQVNGQPATPSLLVDFGTIPARSRAVGVWNLVSSLQGFFSDYSATFTYKGPINDDRLALVKSVDIFELAHCVLINSELASRGGGLDDGLPDFLINKLLDIDRLPDTLVSSVDGEESPVFVAVGGNVVLSEAVSGESYNWRVVVELDLPSVPAGVASPNGDWFYFRFDDPRPSDFVLSTAIRTATNTELLLDDNVWRTAKTKRFVGVGPVEERFMHILDFASPTGIFELRYNNLGGARDLVAIDVGDDFVSLSWSPPDESGVYYYNVLRKVSSQPDSSFVLVASNIQTTDFDVYGLSSASAYTFRVATASVPGQYSPSSTLEVSVATTGTSQSSCGNGILDTGEECDDGNRVDGDCCSSTCSLEPSGTVCRTASGACDVADTCNGISPTCGENKLQAAGTECGYDSTQQCTLVCSGLSSICPTDCDDGTVSTTNAPTPAPVDGGISTALPTKTPTDLPTKAPTRVPTSPSDNNGSSTDAPTPAPGSPADSGGTNVPTPAPMSSPNPPTDTAVPTKSPTDDDDDDDDSPTGNQGGGGGDPHFKLWRRDERFSFHGECDLVLVHQDALTLHVRTTIDSYYSYIESAALRVGNATTIEMQRNQIYVDGTGYTKVDLPLTLSSGDPFSLYQTKDTKLLQEFKLDLHHDKSSYIVFKFYRHFLTITINVGDDETNEKDFAKAVGLLGEFSTGNMLGRDGRIMTNVDEFGFEWQVRPGVDAPLFRHARAPQLPYERCRMPTTARPSRRRLRSGVNEELLGQAQVACDHLADKNKNTNNLQLCIDDIMMTGDIGLAEAW